MVDQIEPAALLARLLDELGELPVEEHLAALEALNSHDVALEITGYRTVTVTAGPCTVEIPLSELMV